MKKLFLSLCFISTLSLVACNNNAGATKTTYEDFYNKTQEIEDYHHSEATLTITYFSDFIQGEEVIKENRTRTYKYTWNTEANMFAPVEEYDSDFANEISKTAKELYANKPQDSEDNINMGYEYYINPFKVYVDYTETIESRTIRSIESFTYDKYGFLTNYLLQVEAEGTYKDQPISGMQKIAYSVSYK